MKNTEGSATSVGLSLSGFNIVQRSVICLPVVVWSSFRLAYNGLRLGVRPAGLKSSRRSDSGAN
jgi:hypothetical protein